MIPAFVHMFWTRLRPFVLVLAVSGAAHASDDDRAHQTLEILAYGDSLTAGYGLGPGEGFTDQLEAWMKKSMTRPVKVTNGGISGETSSGGRSRLDWTLAPFEGGKPDLVLLALGANDGLRGVNPDVTRENLDAMVARLKEKGIPVMLLGMLAPPNLGPDYADGFNSIYDDLARKYDTGLYPFFLDGVAADPSLNQADGLHPTAEGVAVIVSKVGPAVLEYLERL